MFLLTAAAQAASLKSDREFARLRGKVQKVSRVDKSGFEESQIYDEAGNLISTTESGLDAYLQHNYVHVGGQTVFEYWSNRPLPPSAKIEDSRLSAKWIYKFDGNGNRTEKSIFNKKGVLTSKERYICDKRGRLTSQSIDVGKVKGNPTTFILNDDGNVIEKTADGQKTTYHYVQFDPAGNWTQRTASQLKIKEGELEPTLQDTPEERTITYY